MGTAKIIMNSWRLSCKCQCILLHFNESWRVKSSFSRRLKSNTWTSMGGRIKKNQSSWGCILIILEQPIDGFICQVINDVMIACYTAKIITYEILNNIVNFNTIIIMSASAILYRLLASIPVGPRVFGHTAHARRSHCSVYSKTIRLCSIVAFED